MQDLSFADLAALFPAVLAPALVARIRQRLPGLDGWAVWLAVVVAAVLFSLAIAALFGQMPDLAVVRRGVMLGLVAAGAHTVASSKPAEAKPKAPEKPTPDLVWTDDKPVNGAGRMVDPGSE